MFFLVVVVFLGPTVLLYLFIVLSMQYAIVYVKLALFLLWCLGRGFLLLWTGCPRGLTVVFSVFV